MLVAAVACAALALPVAASASDGTRSGSAGWIAPGLLDTALSAPNQKVDVIITSASGTSGAANALKAITGGTGRRLDAAGGVAATLPAGLVAKLQDVPGLTVTPDAVVHLAGSVASASSSQLWPYASGNALLWPGDLGLYAGKAPAIAVVDSGVEARSDFGSRVIASVNLSTIAGNTGLDDQRGHGTFVAGIAAGAAANLTGAAPGAPLVSVKVLDQTGAAKTSDVIAACQWILDHKGQYNIRVANFSLHSSFSTNSYRDPLDKAVERLWSNGVVVVAAAGNYGSTKGPSGVLYAPANDPFVITVGAIDLANTVRASDDTVAPWSAYGYTPDGFAKPDVSAPGRYMVGPVPEGSTITTEKGANLVGSDRIQLSGTSFAAPVVSGTAADLLARHPSWTPDQVKGVLMRTARKLGSWTRAAGVGEITASRAAAATYAPNPNLALERYTMSLSEGGGFVLDAQSWASAAKADQSWNAMSWSSQSWSDMSWSDQSWASMSWSDMSWSSMSWTDMSWSDMSWTDASNEAAAEGDKLPGNSAGYASTSLTAASAATDPDTAIAVDGLDPAAALGVGVQSP